MSRYIDADRLKEFIKQNGFVYANTLDSFETEDVVKVVHGYWIDNGELDEDGNKLCNCSVCGVGDKQISNRNCPLLLEMRRKDGSRFEGKMKQREVTV